tara:strand:+ start:445 stop:777 length:333 start_codon:yes stop_codon:yes gene_type:complete
MDMRRPRKSKAPQKLRLATPRHSLTVLTTRPSALNDCLSSTLSILPGFASMTLGGRVTVRAVPSWRHAVVRPRPSAAAALSASGFAEKTGRQAALVLSTGSHAGGCTTVI